MQPFPADTTYCIDIAPRNGLAQNWFNKATTRDLKMTIAQARDLARDLESPIELRDIAGFLRVCVDATGNYRFV